MNIMFIPKQSPRKSGAELPHVSMQSPQTLHGALTMARNIASSLLIYSKSCYCIFLYSVPQRSMATMMGRMDSPSSNRAYSTRGGTSG